MKNIEDLINDMDWDPNKLNPKQLPKLCNPKIQDHYNKVAKERLEILKNPHYLENSDELWECAITSLNDIVSFVVITDIQNDKNLTFEEKKSKIRKLAPTEIDFKIIGLNGKTMIQDIIMPQLIKFWTEAHQIVGNIENFKDIDEDEFEKLVHKIFNNDNDNPMKDGAV